MDKKITKTIIALLAGILLALGAWWVIQCQCVHPGSLTPAAIRDYIRGYGKWAAVVYVAAYAVNTVSLFPPIGLLSLAAGLAFGKIAGGVLLMAGALSGTSITFYISRLFGRSLVERIMAEKLKRFDDLLGKKGFSTILFLRVIPLIPYEVINYASGLTRISFKDYFLATFLGLIPGVVISAYFGGTLGEIKGIKDLVSFKFIAAAVVLILAILVPFIYQRLKKKGVPDGM